MKRHFSAYGMVLKRVNLGETDQIVHFLSQTEGNFGAVIKGIRKLKSKKLGSLEPGNLVKAFFVKTKNMPLLTQVKSTEEVIDHQQLSLYQLKTIFQLLEVFDRIFVAETLDDFSFQQVIKLRQLSLETIVNKKRLQTNLADLIAHLGFQHPTETKYSSLTAYIEALTERELNSGPFLTVTSKTPKI